METVIALCLATVVLCSFEPVSDKYVKVNLHNSYAVMKEVYLLEYTSSKTGTKIVIKERCIRRKLKLGLGYVYVCKSLYRD